MSAAWHPIVVHFAIACVLVGVALRCLALVARVGFAGPAACTLTGLGALAACAAAHSGGDARVLTEDLPGIAPLVAAHAASGARARDLAMVVALLELVGATWAPRALGILTGVVGLVAALAVVDAGRRGGELVYGRAAGVGVRTGDPHDVTWLLVAGLHEQAALDRRAGRPRDAAALLDLAGRRFGDEPAVVLEAAESALHDAHDPRRALALLAEVPAAVGDREAAFRRGWLESEARAAVGDADGARAALATLAHEFPDSSRVRRRLAASDLPRGDAIRTGSAGVVGGDPHRLPGRGIVPP